MKKIIFSLIMICLLAMSAYALVPYSGQPQLPYIIYGHVEWSGQMLSGSRLEVTNQNTGFSEIVTTDGAGYYQIDANNWLTTAGSRPPVQYGDVIKIKATDGCGTADVCEKTFTAKDGAYADFAVIDLTLTGVLSCPIVECPECGGCGGSGGGIVYKATQELCDADFPCDDPITCPPTSVCTPEQCESTVCPPKETCEVCEICEDEECPEEPQGILAYLLGIAGVVVGGISTYYLKRKDAQMPNGTFVKFGGAGVKHLHRGIRGYHDPQTSHREAHEKHPRGETDPKYVKNDKGVYVYEGD